MSLTRWTTKTPKGKWHNGVTGETVTIVKDGGGKSTGRVVCWTGPAECELDNGSRGRLVEAQTRRDAQP